MEWRRYYGPFHRRPSRLHERRGSHGVAAKDRHGDPLSPQFDDQAGRLRRLAGDEGGVEGNLLPCRRRLGSARPVVRIARIVRLPIDDAHPEVRRLLLEGVGEPTSVLGPDIVDRDPTEAARHGNAHHLRPHVTVGEDRAEDA